MADSWRYCDHCRIRQYGSQRKYSITNKITAIIAKILDTYLDWGYSATGLKGGEPNAGILFQMQEKDRSEERAEGYTKERKASDERPLPEMRH